MNEPSKHNSNTPTDDAWGACQANELVNLGSQLRAQETRSRQWKMATAAATGVAAILVLSSLVWTNGTTAGGITCSECYAQFGAFHTQLATGESSLDENSIASMTAHLEHCERCRIKFEERFPGEFRVALRYGGRQLARRDVQTAMGLLQLASFTPNGVSRTL